MAVPLDHSEWHRFSLYSVHEFSPRFVLENHRIDLGIGNSGLSTLDLKHKLPAFVQHNLSLACARNANFSSCEFTVSAVISLSNWNYLRSCPVVHAKAMPAILITFGEMVEEESITLLEPLFFVESRWMGGIGGMGAAALRWRDDTVTG